MIGSVGGDGSNQHVNLFVEIVHEISKEDGYSFKLATIYSDIPIQHVVDNLSKIKPCGPVPTLTEEEARASTVIVAQMGAEPFMQALDAGAQIVIAGSSIFAGIYMT
jgi:hypothetical protein